MIGRNYLIFQRLSRKILPTNRFTEGLKPALRSYSDDNGNLISDRIKLLKGGKWREYAPVGNSLKRKVKIIRRDFYTKIGRRRSFATKYRSVEFV